MRSREEILENLNEDQRRVVTRIDGRYAVIASPGSGKAVNNNTLVQTPKGPVKIKDLTIGQEIFGTDGEIYHVEGKYPQGKKKIWEVEFSEGTTIEACEDHLWTFQQRNDRKRKSRRHTFFETMTTKEIYENIDLYKKEGKSKSKPANVFMPDILPVEYEEKELPLDPYLLGLLLGDGGFRGDSVTFSNSEEDILNKFTKLIESYGNRVVHQEKNDYYVRTKKWRETTVRDKLEELKLFGTYSTTKFIPKDYLLSSVSQRLNLLNGLIDTDAYCIGSSYEYSTSSSQLASDIKTLCQSLGVTAKISVKEKPSYKYKGEYRVGSPSYRIRIKPSVQIPKLHTSEKHEKVWRKGQSSARVTMTDIRPTDREVEMTCISVSSPNSLFLVEDFIPTHNTYSMISRAEYLIASGVKPYEILMITFTKKAAGEINERLLKTIGPEAVDIDTGTFHSIALRILLTNQALLGYDKSLTVIDEDESFRVISDLAVSHGYSSDEGGKEIQDAIERFQMENLTPQEVRDLNEYPEDVVVIYDQYQELKRVIGYVDFNDILNLTLYLLEKYPNIREKYAKQYKYVLVDFIGDPME